MNKVINKFTKKQWAVFAVALVCACLFTATTVYAAGDVSTAITSTWNSAKSQIKNSCKQCCFPCCRYNSRCSFLCENRHSIFWLQKTRSVWICGSGYSFCLSNIYAYSATLYLGHCRYVIILRNGIYTLQISIKYLKSEKICYYQTIKIL